MRLVTVCHEKSPAANLHLKIIVLFPGDLVMLHWCSDSTSAFQADSTSLNLVWSSTKKEPPNMERFPASFAGECDNPPLGETNETCYLSHQRWERQKR